MPFQQLLHPQSTDLALTNYRTGVRSDSQASSITILLIFMSDRFPKSLMVLLVQSPCVQRFEKPKLKTSELGVRKGLFMEKSPTEKMGALVALEIHLKKLQNSGFLHVK